MTDHLPANVMHKQANDKAERGTQRDLLEALADALEWHVARDERYAAEKKLDPHAWTTNGKIVAPFQAHIDAMRALVTKARQELSRQPPATKK